MREREKTEMVRNKERGLEKRGEVVKKPRPPAIDTCPCHKFAEV